MIYPDVFITSEKTGNIVTALLKLNKAMGTIAKTSKNPFFKSDYADLPTILSAIKDPMEKNELTLNHFPVGDNRLITRLTHSSGEFYQGMCYMKSVKDTPQDRGSVITYMMRYNVGAYLGLSIDKDDDGNKGSARTTVVATPTVKAMTDVVMNAMLQYITDGNYDAVVKQLPKYGQNAKKTVVNKALKDAKNLKDLVPKEDIATLESQEALNPKK